MLYRLRNVSPTLRLKADQGSIIKPLLELIIKWFESLCNVIFPLLCRKIKTNKVFPYLRELEGDPPMVAEASCE